VKDFTAAAVVVVAGESREFEPVTTNPTAVINPRSAWGSLGLLAGSGAQVSIRLAMRPSAGGRVHRGLQRTRIWVSGPVAYDPWISSHFQVHVRAGKWSDVTLGFHCSTHPRVQRRLDRLLRQRVWTSILFALWDFVGLTKLSGCVDCDIFIRYYLVTEVLPPPQKLRSTRQRLYARAQVLVSILRTYRLGMR
jgi:hypothetical protein